MKKVFLILLACLIVLSAFAVTSAADEKTITVTVTICDETGAQVVALLPVTVSDRNGDGAFDVDETLYAAHEAKYPGGAKEGYASYTGQYGLSLSKLWGKEGSGFGYYVNNAGAFSLADTVKDGDAVNAFVYTDTETWSDTYCFFTERTVKTTTGTSLDVTLCAAGFDKNYQPVTLPVKGAKILVNGEDSGVLTDENGKAALTLGQEGEYLISASSETQRLVPPAMQAFVRAAVQPPVAGSSSVLIFAGASLIALALCLVVLKKKSGYEA